MLRVIREVRPRWILGENVPGVIHMELDTVLSDLEGLGYACRPIVIPACAVDAWHRRDRVWILGHSHSHSHSQPTSAEYAEASELPEIVSDSAGLGLGERWQGGVAAYDERGGYAKGTIIANANANATSNGGQGRVVPDQHGQREAPERGWHDFQHGVAPDIGGARLSGLGLGLGTETEYAALGNPCRWPAEPAVARVVHGLPGRVDRVRSLGNAVVPQIPEIIGRAILAQVQEQATNR